MLGEKKQKQKQKALFWKQETERSLRSTADVIWSSREAPAA